MAGLDYKEQGYYIVDAKGKSSREINDELYDLAEKEKHIAVINTGAKHLLGVGLKANSEVVFDGNVGTYTAGLIEDVNINIKGNAGWFLADNLMNSQVIVEGNAGAAAAVGMRGGILVIKNNAASRIGQVMKGGTVVVGRNAAFMAGMMMMGGRIVILGNAGTELGESIMGGAIFVAGEIASLGKDAIVVEPEEKDIDEINAIITAHFPTNNYKFKKIISEGREIRYKTRGEISGRKKQ